MTGRDDGPGRALTLVRALGLRPARVRRGKVLLRCPLPGHDDRRASAAVFDSGVLSCSVCGNVRPFDWITARGLSPEDALALLVELGVLADRRPELASPRKGPPARPVVASSPSPSSRREPVELSSVIADRLAATVIPRRALDGRLFELRAFLPDVLDRADVGVGRASDFGRFGPDVSAAADERRLVLPLPDDRGRLIGVLFAAPNPERRAEPKILALTGSTRVPLVLEPAEIEMRESLLVVEGELDALAACSCGLAVVGVPGVGSATAHAERIAALVKGRRYRSAILVPDADEAGRAGFANLAGRLRELNVERVVLADVLDDGDDVGGYLTRAALAAAGSPAERCAIAGAALRALLDQST